MPPVGKGAVPSFGEASARPVREVFVLSLGEASVGVGGAGEAVVSGTVVGSSGCGVPVFEGVSSAVPVSASVSVASAGVARVRAVEGMRGRRPGP